MSKLEISQEILLEFSKKESTGSCTFRLEDLPLNPLTKSKYWTIKGKSQSRDHWYQFSKKQLLYIDKSRCRMGLIPHRTCLLNFWTIFKYWYHGSPDVVETDEWISGQFVQKFVCPESCCCTTFRTFRISVLFWVFWLTFGCSVISGHLN